MGSRCNRGPHGRVRKGSKAKESGFSEGELTMWNLSRSQQSGNLNTRQGFDHSTRARLLSIAGIGRTLLFAAAALLILAGTTNAQNWTLVWSDEFNGPAGPFTPTSSNNKFWTFETGQGFFGTAEIEAMISGGTHSHLDGKRHL